MSSEKRHGDAGTPATWSLIRRIQAGDRKAGDLLCLRWGPRVARLVRRHLSRRPRGKLETDDLVQSSLRELFDNIDRFTYRGEAAFVAWIGRIVENKIRCSARYWNAKGRSVKREEPVGVEFVAGDGPTPSQEVRRIEDNEHLHRAIDRLPARQRRVVIHRKILELPWEAIAEASNTTVRGAQMLLTRAMKGLARELKHLNDGL